MASPMTNPLSVSASGIRASPTQRIIETVMRSMPPVCFRASASTEPSTITTAMLRIVLPNPCSKASMNACRSRPGTSASRDDGHEQREEYVPLEARYQQEQQRDDRYEAADGDECALGGSSNGFLRARSRAPLPPGMRPGRRPAADRPLRRGAERATLTRRLS